MIFDPSKFGAVPVSKTGFDPSQFGATPVQSVGVQAVNSKPINLSEQGAAFPVSQEETFTPMGAAKAIGNIPQGIWNFVKGTVQFLNPVQNLKTIAEVVNPYSDLYQGGAPTVINSNGTYSVPDEMNASTLDLAKTLYSNVPKEAYRQMVPQSIQKALTGDVPGAVNQLENHPEEAAQIYYTMKGAAHAIDSMKWNAGDFESQIKESMPDASPQEQQQAIASAKANFFKDGFTGKVEALSGPTMAATKFGLNLGGKALNNFINLGSTISKFATSQATGMSPNTISEILSNPDAFSKSSMQSLTRESVGQEVIDTINQRLDDLSETGKEYGNIRGQNIPIKVDPNWLDKTIKENTGLDIQKEPVKVPKGGLPTIDAEGNPITESGGKLVSSASSEIRQPGDVSKLQQFYNRYQPLFEKGQMTSNEFLNMRADLAKLAKYEGGIGKSADLENLTSITRGQLNTEYRGQVPGLESLDKQYAPEIEQLNKLKKDYFNADGNIKDNAFSKIANLTNKGRESVLNRLEQISPGISEKISTLKAIEDIQNASGQKVGTYTRAVITGGGLIGALMNPSLGIPAALGAILTMPDNATQILRGYGKLLGVKDIALNNIINSYEGLKQSINKGELKNGFTPSMKGNNNDTLSAVYNDLKPKAEQTQSELKSIAQKYPDATFSDPGIKSEESFIRKINSKYSGDSSKVTDLSRGTLISDNPKNLFEKISKENGVTESQFLNHGDTPMGYERGMINIQGSSGMIGELQVATPDMIFAKESPTISKSVLGKDIYNQMIDKYGDIGGQGHKIYEEWRILSSEDKLGSKGKSLEQKSRNYYKQFTK